MSSADDDVLWFLSLSFNEFMCCIFLFKQKTAYEMRISDWSSDVCSSDLSPCRCRRCCGGWRPAEPADRAWRGSPPSCRGRRCRTPGSRRSGRASCRAERGRRSCSYERKIVLPAPARAPAGSALPNLPRAIVVTRPPFPDLQSWVLGQRGG